MNLNDIKGIVEIDGLKFDPKEILRALVEQGLKVHSLNGTLLIGRTFIDQSPDLKVGEENCSMSPYCKIYDRIHSNSTKKSELNSSASELKSQIESLNQFPLNFQSDYNKNYVERVEINNEDIDIQNLFNQTSFRKPKYDRLPFEEYSMNEEDDLDGLKEYIDDPTEMIGISPLTKYGPSKIDINSIPAKYRGKCPNCGTIINVNWKFCGKCGNTM